MDIEKLILVIVFLLTLAFLLKVGVDRAHLRERVIQQESLIQKQNEIIKNFKLK